MLPLVFGFLTILINSIEGNVLIADMTMSRMVELNADEPHCTIYKDRGVIQRMVLGTDPKKVRQMSKVLLNELEKTCMESRRQSQVKYVRIKSLKINL